MSLFTLMQPAKANQLAEDLNSDQGDDFSYRAMHDPNKTGQSYVMVIDEDGNDLGPL